LRHKFIAHNLIVQHRNPRYAAFDATNRLRRCLEGTIMKIVYTTEATATGGGRAGGHSGTKNGRVSVDLSIPKEMGGDNGPGTNPEELFATGYAACYLGALQGAARKEKIKLPEGTTVTASVSFADREDGVGYTIVPALSAHIPGFDKAQIEDLMQKAHQICPYSDLITKPHEVQLTAG
jgi:osmotically inducible protein OsmC